MQKFKLTVRNISLWHRRNVAVGRSRHPSVKASSMTVCGSSWNSAIISHYFISLTSSIYYRTLNKSGGPQLQSHKNWRAGIPPGVPLNGAGEIIENALFFCHNDKDAIWPLILHTFRPFYNNQRETVGLFQYVPCKILRIFACRFC